MYQENIDLVLNECRSILSAVASEDTELLIEKILNADQVFFVGVGRVLLSLKSVAKRLFHLGICTHIVGEITEPAIKSGDLLIAASGSGESLFPKAIAQKAKALGAEVVMIGSNRESTLAKTADFMIRVPTNTKMKCPDEIPSEQIMTSLFEQFLLLYGDIVAKMIVERKQLDMDSLWEYHANLE
ncbi:MAG: SIS domain-containing protein [Ruminococcaceae bacterium]|nr:SIS domain-containing protein [Oscillospiraceae bacterium]